MIELLCFVTGTNSSCVNIKNHSVPFFGFQFLATWDTCDSLVISTHSAALVNFEEAQRKIVDLLAKPFAIPEDWYYK